VALPVSAPHCPQRGTGIPQKKPSSLNIRKTSETDRASIRTSPEARDTVPNMMNSQFNIAVARGAGSHGLTSGCLPAEDMPARRRRTRRHRRRPAGASSFRRPRSHQSVATAAVASRAGDVLPERGGGGREREETMNLNFGNANARRCAPRAMMYRDDVTT